VEYNLFVCRGHKAGKLANAENRGILKTRSHKMNYCVAENEIYRRRKPTSLDIRLIQHQN